jgi:REP element-mobilizing transposase RayT
MKTVKRIFTHPSRRKQSWDYSKPGYYFITIVTKNRRRWFGEIRNGVMHKTRLGEFVEQSWKNTIALRPGMNLWLGEFVVMPDHFHAVIFIGGTKTIEHTDAVLMNDSLEELLRRKNQFGTQSENLASIIRGFKASVTTEARRRGIPFGWQERFHDNILASAGDLLQVQNYIRNNVENWKG